MQGGTEQSEQQPPVAHQHPRVVSTFVLIGAAVVPGSRAPAMVAGLVSMLAFVVLARGPKIRTTAVVEVVLCAALAVAQVLHLLAPSPA